MLFLKPKHKQNELLPPPPPEEPQQILPEIEEKEEPIEENLPDIGLFPDAIVPETIESEIKDLEEEPTKKPISKKEKPIQKEIKAKKPKASLELEQLEKIMQQMDKRSAKSKKEKPIKPKALKKQKLTQKPKAAVKPVGIKAAKKFDFEPLDELEETNEQIELPELEDINIAEISKEPETSQPTEILEAKKEIESAIEKIKFQEKPSLLKRLFAGKAKEEHKEEILAPAQAFYDVSAIQNKINNARQALAKLELETARKDYVEIMQLYNNLKPEEQAMVYNDIKDLYFERKTAESFKI